MLIKIDTCKYNFRIPEKYDFEHYQSWKIFEFFFVCQIETITAIQKKYSS